MAAIRFFQSVRTASVVTDATGTVVFGRDATVLTEQSFTRTGGSGIVLPASIAAKNGPITLGTVSGKTDNLAAGAIDSPVRSALYFVNNTPWRSDAAGQPSRFHRRDGGSGSQRRSHAGRAGRLRRTALNGKL